MHLYQRLRLMDAGKVVGKCQIVYWDVHWDILRATPTAAGPSSSKRSVLWRTRGFAALGFDCCVVVGAVSGACFVSDHMILKVCVCNILLNYSSRNDPKFVGKSVKNGPQIVPKHLQN